MPSLTMQRQAIERRRWFSLFWIWLGVMTITVGVGLVVYDPSLWVRWFSLIFPITIAITGLYNLRKTNRQLAEFTAAHGLDAGYRIRQPANGSK
jgi:uncharacterized membrane protein YfcA